MLVALVFVSGGQKADSLHKHVGASERPAVIFMRSIKLSAKLPFPQE